MLHASPFCNICSKLISSGTSTFRALDAFKRSDDAGVFQLVDDAAGAVVTNFKFALQQRCRTLLVHDDDPGGVLEHVVALVVV